MRNRDDTRHEGCNNSRDDDFAILQRAGVAPGEKKLRGGGGEGRGGKNSLVSNDATKSAKSSALVIVNFHAVQGEDGFKGKSGESATKRLFVRLEIYLTIDRCPRLFEKMGEGWGTRTNGG